jgi:hypothetical protein
MRLEGGSAIGHRSIRYRQSRITCSPQAPSYGSTRFYNGILKALFFLTTSRIVFIFVLFCEALGEALNEAAAAAAVPEGPLLPLTRPGSCAQEGSGFLNLSNLIFLLAVYCPAIEPFRHGLINYKDTKPSLSSLLVLKRVYRLEIQSVMLV